MRAPEPTDASAQSQAGDARGRHDAAGCCQAKRLRRAIEFALRHAGLGTGGPMRRVHADALHKRQIDHQASIAHAAAGGAVAAAAHGYYQVVVACVVDSGNNVSRTRAADDYRGSAVDHPVPHVSRGVEAILARTEHAARTLCAKACIACSSSVSPPAAVLW